MAEPPLPGILGEIAEVAGREAAIAVALACGGQEVYIPSPGRAAVAWTHPLKQILGTAAWLIILDRVGHGAAVYVPKARRACARHLAAQGLGTSEIASRLGITRSTARRYCRDY